MSHFKCLVTGGAGFIGSHISRRLVELGHEVICLDNFDDYYDNRLKEDNIRPLLACSNYRLVRGSILDEKILEECIKDIDFIFHNAARPGIRESIKNPMLTHEVNTTGTLRVLEAALAANVKKVIYASSSSVYGNVDQFPLKETSPTRPISPYGASKLCAENYCEIYREVYGLKTISLRYFTVFGPGIRPDLAISIFTRKALAGEDIDIFGDGNKSRDFTYIDNVIDANILAMTRGMGVYNIGGGHSITIDELARSIIRLTSSSSKIIYGKNVPGDVERTMADIDKARRELGYMPKVDVTEGLKKYIDFVQANRP
ncbi:putative UDP-glucose 4-epimerase [Methanocella conradii HZ254]|uniref:UDP-glucose 4-epimerase n=1 Tax=Methanocella conradii (strain DSM 24694 / JCM 17849 / CGMCC 1.5162 / HZ254) TaxID=1041930 RepID=H8I6R9_METCZ|nr:SDR family oxidoreductase [Methanocella conradii]AFC99389.1 putative UDP-glucose 4-epimerase [Methanocella conradii HZ254]